MISSVIDSALKKEAVFIYPHQGCPGHQRSLLSLHRWKYQLRVYSYTRPDIPIAQLPTGITPKGLTAVGHLSYFNRLPSVMRGIVAVKRWERDSTPDVVFGHGLDCALTALGSFRSKAAFVYEVIDLVALQLGRSALSKAVRNLDRLVLKHTDILTVTSPAYIDSYFSKLCNGLSLKTIVAENLLPEGYDQVVLRPTKRIKPGRPIRIGFIGLIRYLRTLIPMLNAMASRKYGYEFHIFGTGLEKTNRIVEAIAQNSSNIYLHGKFALDDLPKIYGAIDLNCIIYDDRDPNVRLALPNKLYESLYFGVPMVVASNTHLWSRVNEAGGGFSVDTERTSFADDFLDNLNPKEIEIASERALNYPVSKLVFDSSSLRGSLQSTFR